MKRQNIQETAAKIGTRAGLRFEVADDWRGEFAPHPHPVIKNADDRNADFFVKHDHTIYAVFPSDAVLHPDGTRKERVETIHEYRAEHSEVYENTVFGTLEDDTLDITGTKNLVIVGAGNDTVNILGGNNRIYGDGGDDAFFLGTGDYVVGGEGADQFWVADTEFPAVANRIADFELDSDVIGFNNLGIGFHDLTFTQDGAHTLIAVEDRNVAILVGTEADALTSDHFVFA